MLWFDSQRVKKLCIVLYMFVQKPYFLFLYWHRTLFCLFPEQCDDGTVANVE